MTPDERINNAVVQLETDTELLHRFRAGTEDEKVPTESGDMPTVAGLVKEVRQTTAATTEAAVQAASDARIAAQTAENLVATASDQVLSASNSALAAELSASEARDQASQASSDANEAINVSHLAMNTAEGAVPKAAMDGGNKGFVLSKKSDLPMDFEWLPPSGLLSPATEEDPGIARFSTESEVLAGESKDTMTNPHGVQRAIQAAIRMVATVDDLRLLSPVNSGGQVTVAGNGEAYRYSPGDTESIDDGYHVIVADNGARWVRISETAGVYIPNYTPPPKPNRLNAIRSEMESAYQGLIPGGGYYSAGSAASDFVYETAINADGGTNGAFQIRARFGIASPRFSKTGGPLTVKVQMGENLGGVSIAALSFPSEDLPSTSLAARGSLAHAGGGLYELTVSPNTSWSDFFGIQVSLTPVDSRNNETIHPEFWVVSRAWIEQDGVTIMDTSRARDDDGVYVAQIAARVVTTTFFAEKITTTSDEFLINHSRFMTGAQVSACWITNSGGAETGYGNIENPVSLARAAKLCQLGMVRRFIFKDPGIYEFVGPRPTNLFPASDADVIMMAPNGDVEIRAGHWLDLSGAEWLSGGFYVNYDFTDNFAGLNIANGTSRPAIIRYGNKPLTEVVSEALVETTENSYFWDLTNSRFKVNVPDLTAPLVVPECDAIVSATKAGVVRLVNIHADVARSSFIKQLGGQPWCEFYNSGMRGGTIANDIFRHEGGHGFAVDCVAIGAGNDGFNYHDTGSFRLFDCIAMHCKGDGVSPHEECTLELIGGNFSDNVRAGVIPAYGAHCIAYKTEASGNATGIDKYGNFMCLSNSSLNPYNGNPQGDTRMTLIDCRSDGGDYGVVSRGHKSFVYDLHTDVANQTVTPIGSYDSIPSTGYGTVISKSRNIQEVDHTAGDKILLVK